MSEADPLLVVRDLVVSFATDDGLLTAVDGISFEIPRGSTVALVGESGCGKSVTAHAIMRLLPTPPARVAAERIALDGLDLQPLPERKMRRVRGDRIAIIFQDPMSSLNPVYSVGAQLVEAFRIHGRASRRQAKAKAIELLARVGFPEPAARFDDYPHELSGGMRQRVMIAMALSCSPELIIADEPTTALDMLAAAQVGALLSDVRRDGGMSLLLISHDLAAVAESADQVIVLYAGRIVEQGPAQSLLAEPNHPYTHGLLRSVPPIRQQRRRRRPTPTRLPSIEGHVPDLSQRPAGCRFADRCEHVHDRCRADEPELYEDQQGTLVRCFLFAEDAVPLQRRKLDSRSESPPENEP